MTASVAESARGPLVSVCIPSYNHARYVAETVESIVAQSYPHWELIIVDDASTDDSPVILRQFAARYPDKIRLTLAPENRGQSHTTNLAIAQATGQYLVLIASDDRAHPQRLQKQVEYLEACPSVAAVFSKVRYIDADGQPSEPRHDPFNNEEILNLRWQLLQKNFLCGTSGMIRTEAMRQAGRYNGTLSQVEDYDMWLRLLDEHELARLPEPLTDYRFHGENLSSSGRFSGSYETVICILNALDRWPIEKIFGPAEVATAQAKAKVYALLADHCLRLDRTYFGRPLLCTTRAYQFALKAIMLDSNCAEAQLMLDQVYAMLGDKPRAEGGRSIAFGDWLQQPVDHGLDQQHQAGAKAKADEAEQAAAEARAQSYKAWIEKHAPQDIDLAIFNDRFENWDHQPTFHFMVHVKQGEQNLLSDTVGSLGGQLYPNWGLTVLADFDCPDPAFSELDMLQWVRLEEGARLIGTANRYLDEVKTGWVLWITPGSRFEPQFLNVCGDYINKYPQWRLFYTDEDLITPDGERFDPKFKPDFNLDLLRSGHYLGHAVVIQRDTLLELGGFAGEEPAITYDAALKTLDLYGEQAIGHIADVLYHHTAAIPDDPDAFAPAGKQALQSHLARNHVDAEVKTGMLPGSFFVDYALPEQPLVSVIVPTRDRLDLIKPCVDSVLAKTAYPNYEIIIVDNDSREADTLAYFAELEQNEPRVRVIKYPYEYNYSAINNEAARRAKGDYLVLLNNDTVVVQTLWLTRMLAHGLRPEVGIVGCRLVYPDQTLQHAGVVMGMTGVADHLHIGLPMQAPGHMGRAQQVQNFSAVTAACLLIEKSVYAAVGGLDEERFKVLYNDVDLCLKAGEAGYKIVWTPYVTLIHHGSGSLKHITDPAKIARIYKANAAMLETWLHKIARDPAYNRHLSLRKRQGEIETDADAAWDPTFKDRPRVLAYPCNDFGTGNYRGRAPLRELARAGQMQHALLPDHDNRLVYLLEPAEVERLQPDVLLAVNAFGEAHEQVFDLLKQYNRGLLRVFSQDDLAFETPGHEHFRKRTYKDIKQRLRRAIGLCDRLIVATEPMAEAFRGMSDDIRLVPNGLEDNVWQALRSRRRRGPKPRVGWAGSNSHEGDLAMIVPVVEATAKEIDWVFFGLCPDALRPLVAEAHDTVAFADYPAKLASLDLDLALAPLEHNRFNVAKTNLRLLEYGILGWPVICTDIEPYRNAPVCRVPNNTNAWLKAVREYTNDLDAATAEGDGLRQWVLDRWMLSGQADMWYDALRP